MLAGCRLLTLQPNTLFWTFLNELGQSTGHGFDAVTRMHLLDPGLSSVLSSTVGQIEFLLKQKFYNITCQFHKWGVST